jgi:hypothetical protein
MRDRREELRAVGDGPLRWADTILGDLAERANLLQHRRRLSKLGHRASFSPGSDSLWAAGDPPPRPGNKLDVLIDGELGLPAIEQAIRSARSHAHITGWSITPGFALTRGDEPVIVRELLADVSRGVDMRVIRWAGARFGIDVRDQGVSLARRRRS